MWSNNQDARCFLLEKTFPFCAVHWFFSTYWRKAQEKLYGSLKLAYAGKWKWSLTTVEMLPNLWHEVWKGRNAAGHRIEWVFPFLMFFTTWNIWKKCEYLCSFVCNFLFVLCSHLVVSPKYSFPLQAAVQTTQKVVLGHKICLSLLFLYSCRGNSYKGHFRVSCKFDNIMLVYSYNKWIKYSTFSTFHPGFIDCHNGASSRKIFSNIL